MAAVTRYALETQSTSLNDALTSKCAEIHWADDVNYIYGVSSEQLCDVMTLTNVTQ